MSWRGTSITLGLALVAVTTLSGQAPKSSTADGAVSLVPRTQQCDLTSRIKGGLVVNCAVCKIPMDSLGQLPIRTGGIKGGWHLLLGEWADMTEGVLPLDVYRCSRCKRVEFFDLDLSLPER